MNKKTLITSLLTCSLLTVGILQSGYKPWEEGMFPLSEIHKLDLKKAGLKISQNEIYNPNGTSLVDALVNVGGCTGSFISNQGLIITNHHCAFSAVQLASTPEHDYLTNGFVAATHEQEIQAKGLTCRITDSYEDVSDRVLGAVAQITDPSSRLKLINDAMKNIVIEAEKKDPSIKAEVSEMFIGKTYVLFRYKTIQDVRLVYVPNRQIGEYGGETDNWVWPRHTGDFSFMRAYVAPDGKPAKYAKNNIPYTPKKFLKVNPNGTNEEDFVFILGYPGKTFRHRPAQFIEYQQQFLLPYVSNLYDFQNTTMENAGKKDKATEIKLATRIKRNANVLKNYRGKLQGLKGIDLISQKKTEDAALAKFINSNVDVKARYGTLMSDIDNLYKLINGDAKRDLWLTQIYSSTSLLGVSKNINTFKAALDAQPENQKEAFFNKNKSNLKQLLAGNYEAYDIDADRTIFKKMLMDASEFSATQPINGVVKIAGSSADNEKAIDNFVNNVFNATKLKDTAYVFNTLLASSKSIAAYKDPLLSFEKDIAVQITELKPEKDRREGVLNKLMGDYVNVKEKFLKKDFIPDANSTLRLTYGYVRGYWPADASYMRPYTTIKGILEKGTSGNPEFDYPAQIRALWEAKDFGPFAKKDLKDVPVAFLYNMDTTGGNSGSPVMNAQGELIGVNFDRSYSATINDYAWNESYSRSIGVDIRYVLWVAAKIDKANFLLKEIGVKI
ncbi:MAG: S46 family peptidase [Candidatus Pedobacter colombiensis]|uniref:Dipeptidyl-peptidase n=1 Tax=Candidatus Pedobacter colombiensis TaxID=3121371 RepID=A0AAJ5WC01_9SPHI|nr:S46 family peptidase [Pedobacter sp.]WEK21238.1 MAG: S46 family peptidase [Pedobacter sp.]